MTRTDHVVSLGLSRRLAEQLVKERLVTQQQLDEAAQAQSQGGSKLGTTLIEKGFIKEEDLLQFFSRQCSISYISLANFPEIAPDVISLVPEALARQHTLIPFNKTKDRITVAIADPLNVIVLDELKMTTGCEVVAVLAAESEIVAALNKYYKSETSQEALEDIVRQSAANDEVASIDLIDQKEAEVDEVSLEKSAEDAPVIKMVNLILAGAVKANASDIHIEPYQKELRIRYRIDGVLHEQPAPPKKFHSAITSRIKIMSNLDIAERRAPQDGRLKLKVAGREIDVRVAVLPCAPGEKIVMRILDSTELRAEMSQLGFEPEMMAIFKKCMQIPYGINLVTGPTGSGKSTTLYSALANLNTPDRNIITAEDPIEYQLRGINQVQVNAQIGLTFATALRSFLRQDPNIIMVGEIRDLETAQISVNAALTGHLVFSTLHTNDAPGSITRLCMMGVEPFLISSSLLMVAAQRLMRNICVKCKESYEVDVDWLIKIGVPESMVEARAGKVTVHRGKGCENCAKTGYRGRQGIYEVLEVTDPIRQMILNRASNKEIKDQGVKQGMLTLRTCAIRRVMAGTSTIDEMIRVTASDVDV